MTLPRSESETPLRRSAVGNYRESVNRGGDKTMINDDEAERQEARRRTLLQRPRESMAESIEDNETIRKCLEIYNGNQLSKDNAWSLSIIDTLSSLLDRHHKTLSNFKVAGSSLEASSKVYSLRVDSIFLDAMRISAGLNARRFNEADLNAANDDDDAAEAALGSKGAEPADAQQAREAPPKPKKRKVISTVTKNKESLNARLDTAPVQDPVFGKLNSTVGSINASNRLMHNILPTRDSELRLRTNYRFWDSEDLPEEITDYSAVTKAPRYDPEQLVSADWARRLKRYDNQVVLRPLHTGYIISDAPKPTNSDKPNETVPNNEDDQGDHHGCDDFYENPKELSMAFDINAECEPMPELDAQPAVLEVDFNDLEELTAEEQTVLNHCRGLRKKAVVIDDLRPVDGSSKLEYSYRPMDKISQFWAGPSHWKFKKSRGRSTLGQANAQTTGSGSASGNAAAQRARRAQLRRSKPLEFDKCHDNLFQPLDATTRLRKANFQKKWDARKLILPTKHNFDPDFFFKYEYAPSIKVTRRVGIPDDTADEYIGEDGPGEHYGDAEDDAELFDNEHFQPDNPDTPNSGMQVSSVGIDNNIAADDDIDINQSIRSKCNDTVLEIATEFEGAPTQVTKVVVPFAKRAKVIDMKNLKRSCNSLIQKELIKDITEAQIPTHPTVKNEKYAKGLASFTNLYEHLPELLNAKMADSLSPSVALYAVLHLANDLKFRLIPQDDLRDFKIRQVKDDD